jgi:hypothetical protein
LVLAFTGVAGGGFFLGWGLHFWGCCWLIFWFLLLFLFPLTPFVMGGTSSTGREHRGDR